MAADEPKQLTALDDSTKAEEPAVPVGVEVTHDKQGKDRVKDNSEESNTRVPGCQSDPPPEIRTPSLIAAVDSKPLDSLQEITEVQASGSREESKKGIDELMLEVQFNPPLYIFIILVSEVLCDVENFSACKVIYFRKYPSIAMQCSILVQRVH